ncbi:hypothetical protein F5Y16DRAFT_415290 [Xylariaceae sp. FL0255]|nr:hypothetical protein F5Y16DRAFT_415290 [Xylariaceae sp. FL0255]
MRCLMHPANCLIFSSAARTHGTNDQIYADVDYGTFQNPASQVRPKFRYWVNDASANLTRVASDIKDLAQVGAGGVELLGFYNYGDHDGDSETAPLQSDWVKYGWGSAAWKDIQDAVLQAAKEAGLVIDFTQGPNQGAGVPAPYQTDGLLVTLALSAVNIILGSNYSSTLPGWAADASLVAATTGLSVGWDSGNSVLSAASLTDVTSQVASDGSISVQCPSNSTASACTLFAFYTEFTGYREVVSPDETEVAVPQSPLTTWQQNGSWVVDHWSKAGAQVIIDFWNQSLLSGSTPDLITQVGNYLWEDSQEFDFDYVGWTSGLPAAFNTSRGYEVNKYLPLVAGSYVTDEADNGASYVADFRQTVSTYMQLLTELNQDYLTTLCETLGFGNNIDSYRQFAGPANLAGKRVISSEAGATFLEAYQQLIPDMMWGHKRSLVGSVNQFVMHGLPFSGSYGNTTYPGWTAFDYDWSEQQGRRQPSWGFYSDWLGWLSRSTFIAQTGRPLVDIAFYLKSTDYSSIPTSYTPTDLQDAGYTYEYLSPDNFALPNANVSDGVFAPSGQAFKALIVRNTDLMTAFGVSKIVDYANAGLPIIFLGGLPTGVSGHVASGGCVTCPLNATTSLSNVHVVSNNTAASLQSLGITPRTAVTSNGTWFTHWRTDDTTSTDYVFVYNDNAGTTDSLPAANITTGTITFQSAGVPYLYDAWTGDVLKLSNFTQTSSSTTLSLELAGNQSVILGFHRDSSYLPQDNGTLPTVTLRDGVSLDNWTLTVESWTMPADGLTDYDPEVSLNTRTNLTAVDVPTLKPWYQISDALSNISGRGYYSTTFAWPPSNATVDGAVIDFGYILHTARATLNGNALPTLDLTWARVNATQYLQTGNNTLEVVVSTPLGNSLIPLFDQLVSDGRPATDNAAAPPVHPYGLVNSVQIIPYTL